MKNSKQNNQRGFIQYIIVVVAALILIAYFRTDIQNFLNSSPGVKSAILTAINWIQQALLWIVGKLGWTSSQLK
jgi:hydrogenase-4 membrane subunit HyfE